MQQAGMLLLDDLTQTASIGPFDAARHLGRFIRARRLLEDHLRTHRPDLVVLVDFGDFNLPVIAPLVHRQGIPILYYISPQIWAWGRWRLRLIRRYVRRMLVFFAFEEQFYKQQGIPVTWVGHPLVESSSVSVSVSLNKEQTLQQLGLNPWRTTVGLLPGSRLSEINRHLPLMLRAATQLTRHMPGVQFLVPKAPTVNRVELEKHLRQIKKLAVSISEIPIANALQLMQAAIVASGTATLEVAWHSVPMVVVYCTSWPTYLAARLAVRVPHIAMVNLVAGRALVPELLQHQAHPKRIARALISLLRDETQRKTQQEAFQQVRDKLGASGSVARAASVVLDMLLPAS